MKTIFCPRCHSTNLIHLGEGHYKCKRCGYTGILGIDKDIIKKG